MTEVTEWNGKPRYMWVWDNDENHNFKRYVVYIASKKEINEFGVTYPVQTVRGQSFSHCAEIEEEETTRLTYYEISQLLKCFGVEWFPQNAYIHNDMLYECDDENKEVPVNYKIRYKQGAWEEPTRETVWKWWGEEIPGSDITRFVSFIGWDK